MGSGGWLSGSYDRLSVSYAKRMFGELDGKPMDRLLLDRFAGDVDGVVCDVGCGPGHVSRYLRGRGAEVFGIDISGGMVDVVRSLNPEIRFERGDMASLGVGDGSLGGIVAFYSIIHIPPEDVPGVMEEFRRVLVPGGLVLVAFHVGRETRHIEEMWGIDVSLDFEFFETAQMRAWFEGSGFEVSEVVEREPYGEDVEVQTTRAYVFARKPAR